MLSSSAMSTTTGSWWRQRSDKARILVAEDDQAMRRVIVDALRRSGHETHDVGDGASLLLELAQNSRFHYDVVDAVVADVRMPVCSGLQALETIRTVRAQLPFVLLTAFGDADMHSRAERLDAKLLDKPVSMAELIAVVDEAVRARRER